MTALHVDAFACHFTGKERDPESALATNSGNALW